MTVETTSTPDQETCRVGLVSKPRLGPVTKLLEELAEHLPGARRYVSHETLEKLHGASPEALQTIADFADEHGVAVAQSHRASRLVILEGSVERTAQAFDCELEDVDVAGQSYRRPRRAVEPPTALADLVDGVFGLDERPVFARRDRSRHAVPQPDDTTPDAAQTAGGPSYCRPEAAMRRYRFPTAEGRGQTIAILLLGGGFYESDLRQYFGQRMPSIDVVGVAGASNDPAPRPAVEEFLDALQARRSPKLPSALVTQCWWTLEATVDVELIGSFAPGANIVVFFAPNHELGKIEGVNAVLHDAREPSVLSCSWGIAENQVDRSYVETLDHLFKLATLRGMSVCYASGDSGANVEDGQPHAHFPASSPHVLGCGGTLLPMREAAQKGEPESAWNHSFGNTIFATGGGFSQYFPRPAWQRGVPEDAGDSAEQAHRGVPDVAAKADYVCGYDMVLAGRRVHGGGTSSAAPLWAGLAARLNQALGSRVGWLSPLLYRPDLCRLLGDVLAGNNGYYKAHLGWDAATGLGSPDGEALLTALSGHGEG